MIDKLGAGGFTILTLLIVNLLGFIMMFVDRLAMRKGTYRVGDFRFFIIGLILGALGVLLGIFLLNHKKDRYFIIGTSVMVVLDIAACIYGYTQFF